MNKLLDITTRIFQALFNYTRDSEIIQIMMDLSDLSIGELREIATLVNPACEESGFHPAEVVSAFLHQNLPVFGDWLNEEQYAKSMDILDRLERSLFDDETVATRAASRASIYLEVAQSEISQLQKPPN